MSGEGAHVAPSWADRGRAVTRALTETWGSLAHVCRGLARDDWLRPTACPGWSVKDQLSHLIGIERTLLGEADPPWSEPLGEHVKNEFAASNEKWIAARRAESGPSVLDEFERVAAIRLSALGALGEDEWARVGPSIIGTVPYVEFMRVRVFDSWVHEQDVRLALGRPGGSGGQASALALGQVEAAMGFVVGKKAAAPEGSVVHFAVIGPADDGRSFTIGVEAGRAQPVPEGTAPSVAVTLSSLHFLRLGCGRATAEAAEAAGGITLEGDEDLGRKILASMNFLF